MASIFPSAPDDGEPAEAARDFDDENDGVESWTTVVGAAVPPMPRGALGEEVKLSLL